MAPTQGRNYLISSIDASDLGLQELPVELLSAVIEQVDSPSDLATLCLVSKTIYPLAKAKLWRSMSLRGLNSDGYTAFANKLQALVNSSPENLQCVKELDILVLDCDYAFEATTHVDPLIRLSNAFIALVLQRMPELRSFCWGTSHSISRTVLESLHRCHHLRSLSIDMENIDFPCPEAVPANHPFPDLQSLLCVPQFLHLVRITLVEISSLSVLRACCQLAYQCNKTVKYLALGFQNYWAEDDYFLSELLGGAVPSGSWEDPRSCNLREIAKCMKKVVQSVELVSLELISFVWELSMLELPRCITLPSLKHLKITGKGTEDFFREIAKRLQSPNCSLKLRSLTLDAELQVTNVFLRGLRDLHSFSFTRPFSSFTSMLEQLCLTHARTIEQFKLVPDFSWGPARAVCTPANVELLAKGLHNLRELHLHMPFVDGWATPFGMFRNLRLLFLSSPQGFSTTTDPNTETILQTLGEVMFGSEMLSGEQKPRLEYLKLGRRRRIYQADKSEEEGCYRFKVVEEKRLAQMQPIFDGYFN